MCEIRSARPDEMPDIRSLLAAAGLPDGGLEAVDLIVAAPASPLGRGPAQDVAVADREAGTVLGAAGLEIHGQDGLLRSVVVRSDHRGTRVGRRLVEGVLARAREAGLARVYLLTTTAADYFPRFGFRTVDRRDVTGPVRESTEFSALCPASATVMLLDMGSRPPG